MADSSSGCSIGVAADSVRRLTRVPAIGYELQLTPSHDWLEFQRLDRTYSWFILRLTMSCDWFYPATDSSLGGLTQNAADLYFNISSKFKDLFCKIHHFYGLFFTTWFQLPLMQALGAASRTLKKLEEIWGRLQKLEEASGLWCYWF